jgi:rhamnosyltransferase
MEMKLETNQVCAVLVTYYPNMEEIKQNIDSLLSDFHGICIVDNSANEKVKNELQKMISDNSHIINIDFLNDNYGIAKAQNVGIDWAFANKFNAILFLDQDSLFPKGYLSKLCEAYNYLVENGKRVGCLGPVATNRDLLNEESYNSIKSNSEFLEVDKTLSSGSLITKEVLNEVGVMDADLFIDLVDYEWCWRAKNKGYCTYILNTINMPHRLGEGRIKFLGLNIGIPSPIRHYYQFRNTIQLFKRKYIPIKFKLTYIVLLPMKLLFYSLIIPNRSKRLKYMLKGILDGITDKKGSIKKAEIN